MQSLYYLIPTFIIILLIAPVFIHVRLTFNMQDLSGVLCFYLYKIKIKYFMYQIKGKTIILKNEKETKVQELEFDAGQLIIVEQFLQQIKQKSRLKELFVFYNIGVGDAFLSSMIGGAINTFVLTLFTTIKNKKPTASMGIYDTISYNREIFEIAAKGAISISLFDIAYSLVISVILSKKIQRQMKRRKGEAI